MPRGSRRSKRWGRWLPSPETRAVLAANLLAWIVAIGMAVSLGRGSLAVLLAIAAVLSLALGVKAFRRLERKRWRDPIRRLARGLDAFNAEPSDSVELPGTAAVAELVEPIRQLQRHYLRLRSMVRPVAGDLSDASDSGSGEMDTSPSYHESMSRSGTYEPPELLDVGSMNSAEFSRLEMVSRLEPRTLRWLDSSVSEQLFLGWTLAELKRKSFLDIVQDDDRELARQQLRAVLSRGEGHGMIYRVTTARGEARAVELNVGVRYGPDRKIAHLRCHLTDVTAKLRDETELRRRTQELIQANDQLRRTIRELEQLKDRYGDLYQNAPAMYFSLDRQGNFVECNDTMLRTLGYARRDLIGQPCTTLLPGGGSAVSAERFRALATAGPVEFESEWARGDGGTIFVWVTGTATGGLDGRARQSRCAAQDITARRALEAELQVKNERLAAANTELSRKNKELDEFTYVVSHDLQEPLRTLIAFSDFLMRDQGDRLDDAGREHVRYLVEASRRLRALIQDLLELSRAGKVTGEFATVNVEELLEVVKADHAELIRSKGAWVGAEGPLPSVWGDRDRIGQLLANLVGNGLKYNRDPRPVVTVRAEEQAGAGQVVVHVSDNGIGIDPRFHSRIFQLFRRLHTREEYEGTGAGLAICQKIVQAHGGTISVASIPGGGSTFSFTLPGAPRSTPAQPTGTRHAS